MIFNNPKIKEDINSSINKLAYSIDECALLLGVSKGHIRNENRKGKIRLLKSGRRTLVTAEEIQRYLTSLLEQN